MHTQLVRKTLPQSILTYLFLIVGSLIMLIPFFWMIVSSLKDQISIFAYPPKFFPDTFNFSNYAEAMSKIKFGLLLKNTLIIVVFGIVGQVVSSTLVAYGFARFNAPGKNALFVLLMATMMLPWVVTMIPAFVLFRELNWVNTYYPLIVPLFGGNAFFIFLLRQFLLGITRELDEAAKIDGCSSFGILIRILIPLSGPALATIIIFSFNGLWSDFLGPWIYLNNPDKFTMALGLHLFKGSHSEVPWHLVMSASVLFTLPVIAVFFFAQRAFTEGIVMSGVKG